MHCRTWFICLLCLLGSLHLSAQMDSAAAANPYVKNDFGLGLGANIFPALRNEPDIYRFYITKQFFTDNHVIRIGLDVKVEPHSSYKYYFSGYYFGYGWAYPMLKYRLWPYVCADILIQQDVDKQDIYERSQNRFGVAPVAGLQFRIRPWLSFTTELSYAFSLRQTVLKSGTGYTPVVHSRTYDFNINPHRLFSLGINFHF